MENTHALKESLISLYQEQLGKLPEVREALKAYPLNKEQILKRDIKILKDMNGELLRYAKREEYIEWLLGYLLNGGKPTNYCNYPFPDKEFYVAEKGFRISSLPTIKYYTINIIVPVDIKVHVRDLGCIRLFFMNGYKANPDNWVPIYEDIADPIITSLKGLKKKKRDIDTVIENIKQLIEKEKWIGRTIRRLSKNS